MGYTVRVENDVVVIKHTGVPTVQEMRAALRDAAALVETQGFHEILVDASGTTSCLTTRDLFTVSASNPEFLPADISLAVVYPPNVMPASAARFAESVSVNRGVMMRVFPELGVAKQWLAKKAES